MGIKNLKAIIKDSAQKRDISHYEGKRVAIDISIWLYKFVYRDSPNAVLLGFFEQLLRFYRYRIIPVYVFDGKVSRDVKIELTRRHEVRDRARSEIESLSQELSKTLEDLSSSTGMTIETVETTISENDLPMFIIDESDASLMTLVPEADQTEQLKAQVLGLQQKIAKVGRRVRRPTREMVEECKAIFELLGVPYIQSPGEADGVLAQLARNRQVDAIISNDTDMLPYGCPELITKLTDDTSAVIVYEHDQVLADVGLTREQFVDCCILAGCDYADKPRMIGIKTAEKFIKKFGSIERVLEHIDSNPKLAARHPYPENFLDQVITARNIFLHAGDDPYPYQKPRGLINWILELFGISESESSDEDEATEVVLYDATGGGESSEEPSGPPQFEWDLGRANANWRHFRRFCQKRGIQAQEWQVLCRPWSPKRQRKIEDFFGRK